MSGFIPAIQNGGAVLTGPADDGDSGQFLQTDGAGALSFAPAPTAAVDSVNGQTGVVVLSAAQVGAAAASHTHPQSAVTNLVSDLAAKASLSGASFTGAVSVASTIMSLRSSGGEGFWSKNYGGNSSPVVNDVLGTFGYSGENTSPALSGTGARLDGVVDAIGGSRVRAAILFRASDGASLIERMRLTSAGNFGIGDTNPGTKLTVAGPVKPGTYTVGTLPTPAAAGRLAYASNARKSGEGPGAGTGCPVWDDGANWRTYYDNSVAAA